MKDVFRRLGPDLVPEDRAIIQLFTDNKEPLFCASIGDYRKYLTKNRNKRHKYLFLFTSISRKTDLEKRPF